MVHAVWMLGVIVACACAGGCGRIWFAPLDDERRGDASASTIMVIDAFTTGSLTVEVTGPGTMEGVELAADAVGGMRLLRVSAVDNPTLLPTSAQVAPLAPGLILDQQSTIATFDAEYGGTPGLDVALPGAARIRVRVLSADAAAVPCALSIALTDTAARTATVTSTIEETAIVETPYWIDVPVAEFSTLDIAHIDEIRFALTPAGMGADLAVGPFTVEL